MRPRIGSGDGAVEWNGSGRGAPSPTAPRSGVGRDESRLQPASGALFRRLEVTAAPGAARSGRQRRDAHRIERPHARPPVPRAEAGPPRCSGFAVSGFRLRRATVTSTAAAPRRDHLDAPASRRPDSDCDERLSHRLQLERDLSSRGNRCASRSSRNAVRLRLHAPNLRVRLARRRAQAPRELQRHARRGEGPHVASP